MGAGGGVPLPELKILENVDRNGSILAHIWVILEDSIPFIQGQISSSFIYTA